MEVSYTFSASVRWSGERRGQLGLEGKRALEIATPPEFGGPPGVISPEDLFVASAATCFLTTFLAMADKVRASFVSFSCKADATLENIEGKGLIFTAIVLHPKVGIADISEERPITRALELAKKYCLVTNSMTCPVELEPSVQVV
ncbi:MAG: OsmC family protein [Deltaproteobacteria bacterium]|nr:OsmC family protein [Deltaproteobacteria bacterium]